MSYREKITQIEIEMARTQKNKATEYHIGLLRAKLSRYKSLLVEAETKSTSKGEGFDVKKSGDARVALVGLPSVGKSTFINTITETKSEAAAYEFTTLTCIPGILKYNGATIQILDLPGIIEGASQGKGHGKQVIAVARTADLILMIIDAADADVQRAKIERELEAVGIRLNRTKPMVYFKKSKGGGIKMTSTVTLTKFDLKMAQMILHEYKIFNAEIVIREDISCDDFIDVVLDNRVYIPTIYAYNKIDVLTIEDVDSLARLPHSVVISCALRLNVDLLIDMIWRYLNLLLVYTKRKGERPDLGDPIVMRSNSTIEHVCHSIHRDMIRNFKYALVWGTSAKHFPQRVGLHHKVHNDDVVQIFIK